MKLTEDGIPGKSATEQHRDACCRLCGDLPRSPGWELCPRCARESGARGWVVCPPTSVWQMLGWLLPFVAIVTLIVLALSQ